MACSPFCTGAINLPEPLKVGAETVVPGHRLTEVADTGTGIAKEELSRIFKPFFTAKAGHRPLAFDRLRLRDCPPDRGHGDGGKPHRRERDLHHLSCRASTMPEGKVVLIVEDEDEVRVFGSRALKAKGFRC